MLRSALLVVALGIATPAAALDMPSHKPGLWEMKMSTASGVAMPLIQHCVDAASDKQMNVAGGAMGDATCSKQDVRKVDGKLIVDAECQSQGMSMTSRSEITGSFDSSYTIKTTTKVAGNPVTMTVEAKWLGACKADQKPGDMIVNGMKMNINDMQKAQGARPGAPPQR